MSPLQSIFQALFPSTCACCGQVLTAGESQICVGCLADLPQTGYSTYEDNPAERKLLGRIHFEHATAMLLYRSGGTVRQMVHAMKFHQCPELCVIMGRQMGLDLMRSGHFDDVDILLPVPLHWLRQLGRGYNQSELLCRGISEVMARPISTGNLIRHRNTLKQSQQSADNRVANVEGAFRVKKPDLLAGHHVLLVDDVMTTGATLTACADVLAGIPGIRISVATLTIAGN